jgi:hypothetical protein
VVKIKSLSHKPASRQAGDHKVHHKGTQRGKIKKTTISTAPAGECRETKKTAAKIAAVKSFIEFYINILDSAEA